MENVDTLHYELVREVFIDHFIVNAISTIAITSKDPEKDDIHITAPDWLFLCLKKCKQINRHWYKKINKHYIPKLTKIRTTLGDENFAQLQANYRLKILPDLSRKERESTPLISPWKIHDFCYDLIIYEKPDSDYLLKFLASSMSTVSYKQHESKRPFFKKLIEHIIIHIGRPITLKFEQSHQKDIINMFSLLNLQFYDIYEGHLIHNWSDYTCKIYTQELKAIKDGYEKTISCFSNLLHNKKDYISDQLFSCVRKFLLIDRKSYDALHDGYWKHIAYHNKQTRFTFDKDFFCTIANPFFYKDGEIICANNVDTIIPQDNNAPIEIAFLKKIVDIKSKVDDPENAKIIFSFAYPVFLNKKTNELFVKAGLFLQNYIEQENDAVLYKYALSNFNYKDSVKNNHSSMEQITKEHFELERKNFILGLKSQQEEYAKKFRSIQDDYNTTIRRECLEQENLKTKLETQEEHILDLHETNATLIRKHTDSLTEVEETLKTERELSRSTIENLEKKIEIEQAKLDIQQQEHEKEKKSLNDTVTDLRNEKDRLITTKQTLEKQNEELINKNQKLIKQNEFKNAALIKKNELLQNQLKNIKFAIHLTAAAGLALLLLSILWQYNRDLSVVD
ncbi:MAG TPA: hypothetical protein VL201_05755 [Patescibacteria group bacterium]|nr:hypothetical protein [Patescibacteria group bacterium]